MFSFILHRYIIRLSLSSSIGPVIYHLSVPVSSSSLQVPVGESASMPAPEALTSDTAASASSSSPGFPASYTLSGTLSRLRPCCPQGRAEGFPVIPVG